MLFGNHWPYAKSHYYLTALMFYYATFLFYHRKELPAALLTDSNLDDTLVKLRYRKSGV